MERRDGSHSGGRGHLRGRRRPRTRASLDVPAEPPVYSSTRNASRPRRRRRLARVSGRGHPEASRRARAGARQRFGEQARHPHCGGADAGFLSGMIGTTIQVGIQRITRCRPPRRPRPRGRQWLRPRRNKRTPRRLLTHRRQSTPFAAEVGNRTRTPVLRRHFPKAGSLFDAREVELVPIPRPCGPERSFLRERLQLAARCRHAPQTILGR